MCTGMVPATGAEALGMLESALGLQECALRFLAAEDAAAVPVQGAADWLRVLERNDAAGAAVQGRFLAVFDAQDGHLADGQRSTRTWLVHSTRVTKGQAGEYQARQALARGHQVLLAALAEGHVLTKSVALQLAKWTRPIPEDKVTKTIENVIGKIARPKNVWIVSDMPKTRSGKIMRRVIAATSNFADVGDITTLANPEIVEQIRHHVQAEKLAHGEVPRELTGAEAEEIRKFGAEQPVYLVAGRRHEVARHTGARPLLSRTVRGAPGPVTSHGRRTTVRPPGRTDHGRCACRAVRR